MNQGETLYLACKFHRSTTDGLGNTDIFNEIDNVTFSLLRAGYEVDRMSTNGSETDRSFLAQFNTKERAGKYEIETLIKFYNTPEIIVCDRIDVRIDKSKAGCDLSPSAPLRNTRDDSEKLMPTEVGTVVMSVTMSNFIISSASYYEDQYIVGKILRGDDLDPNIYSKVSVDVITSDGTILNDSITENRLEGIVYYGSYNVSSSFDSEPTRVSWTRNSPNKSDDTIWNSQHIGVGLIIVVDSDDVDRSAQFNCIVNYEGMNLSEYIKK